MSHGVGWIESHMCACVYLSLDGQDGSVFEDHAQRIHKKQTETSIGFVAMYEKPDRNIDRK